MSVNKYLEWHSAEWRRLWESPAGPPHAVLLVGPAGIGKSIFAGALAQRLLCESALSPADSACGECPSCRLFAAGNHPDFRHVIPEADAEDGGAEASSTEKRKASSQIRIDQIRGLEDFVYVGGHRGGRRVILIEPADAMNVAAENSLLKILEEPPSSVCFVLVSSNFRKLLPTIRSRCRMITFRLPGLAQARDWLSAQGGRQALDMLALCGGAPIRALEEVERGRQRDFDDVVASLLDSSADFLALGSRWESRIKADGGLKMDELVAILQKALYDLASFKVTRRLRFLVGREAQVETVSRQASLGNLVGGYGELIKARALASHPLNPRLYLDEMAARYLRAIAPART